MGIPYSRSRMLVATSPQGIAGQPDDHPNQNPLVLDIPSTILSLPGGTGTDFFHSSAFSGLKHTGKSPERTWLFGKIPKHLKLWL